MGLDNPELTASIYEDTNVEDWPKTIFLNFHMKFWETGYSLKIFTKKSVALQARNIFASEYARTWWTGARKTYQVEADTKLEKEFFTVVDGVFQDVMQSLQSSNSVPLDQLTREQ